jgi:hypothetical protein
MPSTRSQMGRRVESLNRRGRMIYMFACICCRPAHTVLCNQTMHPDHTSHRFPSPPQRSHALVEPSNAACAVAVEWTYAAGLSPPILYPLVHCIRLGNGLSADRVPRLLCGCGKRCSPRPTSRHGPVGRRAPHPSRVIRGDEMALAPWNRGIKLLHNGRFIAAPAKLPLMCCHDQALDRDG